jgi:toxin ParE1/3/4
LTARILIASTADADVEDIFKDLAATAGHRIALRYNDLFERLYDQLADHPDSGAPRPALGPEIRIGIVSPYIVIYRHSAEDGTVTVLRVVHGRRRITDALLNQTHQR